MFYYVLRGTTALSYWGLPKLHITLNLMFNWFELPGFFCANKCAFFMDEFWMKFGLCKKTCEALCIFDGIKVEYCLIGVISSFVMDNITFSKTVMPLNEFTSYLWAFKKNMISELQQ